MNKKVFFKILNNIDSYIMYIIYGNKNVNIFKFSSLVFYYLLPINSNVVITSYSSFYCVISKHASFNTNRLAL